MKPFMVFVVVCFVSACSINPVDAVVEAEAKFINGYCKVVGEDQQKIRLYHDVKLRGAGSNGVVRIICD